MNIKNKGNVAVIDFQYKKRKLIITGYFTEIHLLAISKIIKNLCSNATIKTSNSKNMKRKITFQVLTKRLNRLREKLSKTSKILDEKTIKLDVGKATQFTIEVRATKDQILNYKYAIEMGGGVVI